MDPRDFQQLALELVQGRCPAELRTAISRAYYAAYNVSAEILKGMGFRINEGTGGHGDVQNRLGNSGDPDIKSVGSQLADLHGKRIRADYHLDKKDVENWKTAQAVVEQAGKIIQTLETCRSGPKREQIINAIRQWEDKIQNPKGSQALE